MSLETTGIGVPWSEDIGRRIHTDHAGANPAESLDWSGLVCPNTRAWTGWLGSIGYAFSAGESTAVNAIAGAAAWGFDADQIERWLAGGLLLDGPAAAILHARGFGEWIGFDSCRFITQADALYSVEECTDAGFGTRLGAQMGVNLGGYSERMLQAEMSERAHNISRLLTPTQELAGHGAILFGNALGGRVAIVPWTATGRVVMTPQRAAQLHGILQFLAGENPLGRVHDGVWVFPQFLTDGAVHRAVIWNASPDEIGKIEIEFPGGFPAPHHAIHIDAKGRRHECTMDGKTISLREPMHQWELVVLM
jgi:hypothetical protein